MTIDVRCVVAYLDRRKHNARSNKTRAGIFLLDRTQHQRSRCGKAILFGAVQLDAEDTPAGPDMVYTMLRIRGLEVGAMCGLQPDQKAQGVPPHWMTYISVESANDAAEKAKSLGATI